MTHNVFGGTLNLVQSVSQSVKGHAARVMMTPYLSKKHLFKKCIFPANARSQQGEMRSLVK